MQVSLVTENHVDESVCVCINIDGTEFSLATLETERLPHQAVRFVSDRTLTISHNSKNGSVSCLGFTSEQPARDLKSYPSCATVLFF